MHPFHISDIVTERAPAADGVYTHDLGVRPLSVLLLNLKPLNDTGTLANWCNAFRIAQSINRLSILARGENIISMRGEDVMAMNFYRWGMVPQLLNPDNTDNERRSLTLPIIMGRYPFMASSCFPAMGKGELVVELDIDIVDTGYDGMRYSLTALELPNASPKEYEKRVQQTFTNNTTGFQDIDITVGNLIRGMLLWGTTSFTGATPAPSWGSVSALLDNAEIGYRAVTWETLQMLHALMGRLPLPPSEDDHKHTVNAAGAGIEETAGGGGYNIATTYQNYAFMDFDQTGDDTNAIDTANASRLQLRTDVETADAVRCIPIERITV